MPRIRSLKPEALQHRKVGRLTDREFRVWVGMLTQADDEGRLVADPDQLRLLIFGYWPKVKTADMEAALERLDAFGLIRRYTIGPTQYADFPSWTDHQRINRPNKSKLPSYKDSVNGHGRLTDDSLSTHWGSDQGSRIKDQGSEGIGKEGSVRGGEVRPERLSDDAPNRTPDRTPKPISTLLTRALPKSPARHSAAEVTNLKGDALREEIEKRTAEATEPPPPPQAEASW